MATSSFDYTDTIRAGMAIGVNDNNHALSTAPDLPRWNSPCGGLYSNAEDMAVFISFMFRQNQTMGDNQLLDSSTINEMLTPVMDLPDAVTAFGTPWEFEYSISNKLWIKAKAGELPGYRTQLSLVPALKLGVFVSAFRTSIEKWDPTNTAWTVPILDVLIPALIKILAAAQTAPTLPPNWEMFVGNYSFGASIWTNGQILSTNLGQPNLVQLVSFPAADTVLRLQFVQPTTIACRWLDDGADQELLYFKFGPNNSSEFLFMGERFVKQA